MPSGVNRPYNLVDVLGTLNQQSVQTGGQVINGLGFFGEADETVTMSDAPTGAAQTAPGWDQNQWGSIAWS